MKHDYYEVPNLTEKLKQAEKSSSLYANPISQSSGMSGMSMGMLQSSGSGGAGSNNMLEARVARLEADVENIKTNLSEARSDISRLRDISADTSRDVAVVLQKIVDVDEKLSKKPSKSEVQTLISSAVNKQILWTIGTGFALLGIAKYIF
ncbi:hypothetical protein ACOSU5_000127 [Salmonella enterica subsp. enterica serovar Newport]|uniref:Uncharacterized protein n=5 Tax=Salmonella enterica TaxID=28901 RepID=A0A3S4GJS9_SALER|nr:hypothetical protein [Salmonella enterica]SQI65179.1 Uncharacterised protein [Salmonella enterica subsp. diarizonae]VEA75956.1 Uncharacterised protein [Salmonella enterica subsp. arizonae]MCG3510044.1 hypothetical protein [Salmonella enterica subsp. enterica]MCG3518510.1 hypothetical protein [Salmonella enterica subsp. enterica]MDJ6326622.1 hypothetical protein [Salmonella enterica]